MTEVVEYALVFVASSLIAGFSVATYDSFAAYAGYVDARAQFATIQGLVGQAEKEGNSQASLDLLNASIGCQQGSVTFSSRDYTGVGRTTLPCDFHFPGLSGLRTLSFHSVAGALTLDVN